MKTYNIDTATHGELYQIFIPKAIAKTILIRTYDGYGEPFDNPLEEGFYTARCYHDVYAIGKPRYWELVDTGHEGNDPETDSKEIVGVTVKDLKIEMGIEV